ncbi:hypothetical protein FHS89_002706 [Rubricella aquisinus]|uniref:SseB protein N-terminal domain-containing protein n=1 Tax=Rubricella aquisinus TaxID=2028108 RepID=A0A840X4D5_9RHOB|nr:SseB family protein [Rubricella aquisinus]MBB5516666.1 hypothetical protein [Rubricella aquisinus]
MQTPIDIALLKMTDAPDDDAARLQFYERVADAELFLVLEEEPATDRIAPLVLDTSEARLILAFDSEDRMTAFMSKITPYAALSGRRIATMLAGQGIGLALNLGTEGETVIAPDTIDWMQEVLRDVAQVHENRISEVSAPGALPEALLTALDRKLGNMAGLAEAALLGSVAYGDGSRSHLLAFIGTVEGAQDSIADAVGEALRLSGIEAGMLDVAFLHPDAPVARSLGRVALRFDLPLPPEPEVSAPPGSNPDQPPRLK